MCYMVAVGGSEEGVDMVMVVRICVWCFAILGVDEPALDKNLSGSAHPSLMNPSIYGAISANSTTVRGGDVE